jgi:peroxiredoxin Q/BCP
MSAFRDRYPELADAAQVLGVSTDTLETQKKFAESLKTPFPLLADADGTVAKAYGVWNDAGYASRVTFVIDADGKVRAVFEGKDAIDPAGAIAACGRPSRP